MLRGDACVYLLAVLTHNAHAHCDWCEAMHACAFFVCVVVNEYMLTVIAARQYTYVLERVFGSLLTVLCARPCMYRGTSIFSLFCVTIWT